MFSKGSPWAVVTQRMLKWTKEMDGIEITEGLKTKQTNQSGNSFQFISSVNFEIKEGIVMHKCI